LSFQRLVSPDRNDLMSPRCEHHRPRHGAAYNFQDFVLKDPAAILLTRILLFVRDAWTRMLALKRLDKRKLLTF
jgi:hypothetical protein